MKRNNFLGPLALADVALQFWAAKRTLPTYLFTRKDNKFERQNVLRVSVGPLTRERERVCKLERERVYVWQERERAFVNKRERETGENDREREKPHGSYCHELRVNTLGGSYFHLRRFSSHSFDLSLSLSHSFSLFVPSSDKNTHTFWISLSIRNPPAR